MLDLKRISVKRQSYLGLNMPPFPILGAKLKITKTISFHNNKKQGNAYQTNHPVP